MASLITKLCKTPVTIKYPSATITDGKETYTEVSGLARMSDFSQADVDYFGRIQNASSFLIAPLSSKPPVNGKIVHAGSTYDIKAVKVLVNARGIILGYKCAVV